MSSLLFISYFLVILANFFITTESKHGRRHNHHKQRQKDKTGRNRNKDTIGITLEGAECLFGAEWTYAIRPGDPRYVAFIFRGGFPCNNEETCIDDENVLSPLGSYFNDTNPLIDGLPLTDNDDITWTVIQIPSCNRDINLGNQPSIILNETTGLVGNFTGGLNVNRVINDILSQDKSKEITKYINFDKIKHIVLWGASSGSISATVWAFQLFEHVRKDSLKTIILDGWALDSVATGVFTAQGNTFLDLKTSPAYIDDFDQFFIDNIFTIEGLIGELQNRYCELFVSSLFFEFDTTFPFAIFALTGDNSLFDPILFGEYMNNIILRGIENFDEKRSSYYVSQGNNHVAILPQFTINDIQSVSTECFEDPTLQEYLTNVIGNKKLVKKYFGNPQLRVKEFPLKSWNNLLNTEASTTCLQC